jgi:hypothetical protein
MARAVSLGHVFEFRRRARSSWISHAPLKHPSASIRHSKPVMVSLVSTALVQKRHGLARIERTPVAHPIRRARPNTSQSSPPAAQTKDVMPVTNPLTAPPTGAPHRKQQQHRHQQLDSSIGQVAVAVDQVPGPFAPVQGIGVLKPTKRLLVSMVGGLGEGISASQLLLPSMLEATIMQSGKTLPQQQLGVGLLRSRPRA